MHRITTEGGTPEIILINFGNGPIRTLKEKIRRRRVSVIAVANATRALNARPCRDIIHRSGNAGFNKKALRMRCEGPKSVSREISGRKGLELVEDRVAHLDGADLAAAWCHDVASADALVEHVGDRLFEVVRFLDQD